MSAPESALPLMIRLNRWWWLWRMALGGFAVYLAYGMAYGPRTVSGKGAGLGMVLALVGVVGAFIAIAHSRFKIVVDETGVQVSGFRNFFVHYKDMVSVVESESLLWPFHYIEPSWINVRLKPPAERTDLSRNIPLVSSRSYVSIPPMTLPAADLIALLEGLRERYGR